MSCGSMWHSMWLWISFYTISHYMSFIHILYSGVKARRDVSTGYRCVAPRCTKPWWDTSTFATLPSLAEKMAWPRPRHDGHGTPWHAMTQPKSSRILMWIQFISTGFKSLWICVNGAHSSQSNNSGRILIADIAHSDDHWSPCLRTMAGSPKHRLPLRCETCGIVEKERRRSPSNSFKESLK